MSASSKKKLRKEQNAAVMTERQQAALKEAKQTKMMTTAFVIAMVLILAIAIAVGVSQFITNSGIRENNTTALTVNGHELSNTELNYYFIDGINTFYSQSGAYATLFGLDITKPLNEQVYDESAGTTWADYFLESAKSTAASVYAMNDAAKAEGFTLPEDYVANVDSIISSIGLYAVSYGYADADTYLKAMYGPGASLDSLRNYIEMSMIAEAYNNAHQESLTFTEDEIRAADAEDGYQYSAFSYNYYYLAASRFLEGGTTDEEGTTTYSEEEEAASVAAAEEAANAILNAGISSVEDLDAAIAALPINAEATEAKSTAYTDNKYSSIDADLAAWLTESGRKTGDVAVVANLDSTSEDNTVLGYFVVYFNNINDNTFALKNVRHILVSFQGGTEDEYGSTTYSDEEKAAAKTAAQEILDAWKAGEATEDSFAALATEKSDDTGSVENGGLYENIYPGQMVAAFEDWCYDENRKTGDTGLVETTYGYHVMYFSGNSETNYRDYQIENELLSNAQSEWYSQIVDSAEVTDGNTKYMALDLVMSATA